MFICIIHETWIIQEALVLKKNAKYEHRCTTQMYTNSFFLVKSDGKCETKTKPHKNKWCGSH